MTRTTDPEPDRFEPLGHPEPKPEPERDVWVPVPDAMGVERNLITGRLRTNLPCK